MLLISKAILCAAGLMTCMHALADPLLDFGFFTAPAQRAIAEPVVSWVVHPRPQDFCRTTSPRDGSASWREACVVWHKSSSRCTIVTPNESSHSQLGHLFLHCIRGG